MCVYVEYVEELNTIYRLCTRVYDKRISNIVFHCVPRTDSDVESFGSVRVGGEFECKSANTVVRLYNSPAQNIVSKYTNPIGFGEVFCRKWSVVRNMLI